ncbi:MAG: radical SAM protein [Candidatus Omnitrophica bacterium]|nr:radical SAM protein [Candidatus Omnitrophota bacterium]
MQVKDHSYNSFSEVNIPEETDYIGIYLTNRCFLSCSYCIINIFNPYINTKVHPEMETSDWIRSLNRLRLPEGVPLTLQGGEPFLSKGIWEILENVQQKMDILTALPPSVTPAAFKALKTLQWNKRDAPYPTIRVSFHQGQNDYKDLIDRIKELQEILSIGLFHIEHPQYPELTEEIRKYAKKQGIEFRTKIFLGTWEGKTYGCYKYEDACVGHQVGKKVQCRNTVLPVGPNGTVYRCHSDLYANRKNLAIGCLTDPHLKIKHAYRSCVNYGLCSPCDIKIKTNHLQQDGYCSVDIKF